MIDDPYQVRHFWARVDVKESVECWLWTAGTLPSGYGKVYVYEGVRKYRTAGAHRIAWELTNGDIPSGLQVLHRCDQPACCNPAHLWLGTPLDNMRDRDRKGRSRFGPNRPSLTRKP